MHDFPALSAVPRPDVLIIRPLPGRAGLMLAGDADCTVQQTLHAALAAMPADGAGEIHLDLTRLRFIDLTCTRELLAIAERHRSARLIVHNPPPSLERIIALLRPETKIELTETPSSASFSSEGLPGGTLPVPDIADLILAEHARIATLIGELDSALAGGGPGSPGCEAELAWKALAGFLSFHIDAAEEIAYQALAGAEPGTAPALMRASEADTDIRAALDEARLARPGSRVWHMAVQAAGTAAMSHINLIESGPFRPYQVHTPPAAPRVLGRQWVDFMTARALDASARLPRDGTLFPERVCVRATPPGRCAYRGKHHCSFVRSRPLILRTYCGASSITALANLSDITSLLICGWEVYWAD